MGIPRLTSFVDNTFTGWQREEVTGTLIIDGYSMCYNLYSFDWSHGGQYPEYRDRVVQFFLALHQSGIVPVVVMDGIDYREEKTLTTLRRRGDVVKAIHKHTANTQKRNIEAVVDHVLPSLAIATFFLVMSSLGVKFIVADGEGDLWIYQLANKYDCPVLSADSDFLMFRLRSGYIPFNRFHWEASPINAEVFYYNAFCEQFKFRDESVRLIIPAIAGNDFLEAVDPPRFMSYIARRASMESKALNRLISVVKYIQSYDSLDEFMTEAEALPCLENTEKQRLLENCRECRKMYDSDDVTTLENMAKRTELLAFNSEPLPEWVVKQFREGNFSSTFMEALVVGKAVLDVYIDNTSITSCVHASLPIRQFIYGLTGSSLVTEYYREGLEIVGKGIHSSDSIHGNPLPSLDRTPTLSAPVREQLLCSMLGGADFHLLQSLPRCWRLVMAATSFWSQHVNPPPHLVKALVLSFMVCSTCPYELPKMRSTFFIPVDFRRSPRWMSPLHMFAQWQSVYGDAMALNQLLMLPMEAVSPAQLYDGKLAMFFALPENGDHLVGMLPVDHQLYARLVGTIMPYTFTPPHLLPSPTAPPSSAGNRSSGGHHKKASKPPRFQNTAARGGGGGGKGRGRGRGQQNSSEYRIGGGGGGGEAKNHEQKNWEPRRNPGHRQQQQQQQQRQQPQQQQQKQQHQQQQQQTRARKGSGGGGGGGGRGRGRPAGKGAGANAIPPAKVVVSKPPKFTHANRYAALEGEEDSGESAESN